MRMINYWLEVVVYGREKPFKSFLIRSNKLISNACWEELVSNPLLDYIHFEWGRLFRAMSFVQGLSKGQDSD